MDFLLFRGTARKVEGDQDLPEGSVHGYLCMAFASDMDAALESAHAKLKAAGYLITTIDGTPLVIPPEQADLDTEQGFMMREARRKGASVVISRQPGDPMAGYDR